MKLLYFAWVREAIGAGEEDLAVPSGVTDVAGLIDWLSARSEGHAQAFVNRARIRAAVDGVFAPLTASIAGAREIALFPPVTGG